ncbi:DUF2057 family protein [Vibrio sp. M60_M31a]
MKKRGNFTSAPYILTLDVNGGELEIDGPQLNEPTQAKKVFEGDKIDWNVSLNDSDINYDQVKNGGKRARSLIQTSMSKLATYNAANGISFAGSATAPAASASIVNGSAAGSDVCWPR